MLSVSADVQTPISIVRRSTLMLGHAQAVKLKGEYMTELFDMNHSILSEETDTDVYINAFKSGSFFIIRCECGSEMKVVHNPDGMYISCDVHEEDYIIRVSE